MITSASASAVPAPRPDDSPVLRRSAEASAALSALLPPPAAPRVPRPYLSQAAPSWQYDENVPSLQDHQIAAVIEAKLKAAYPGWSPPSLVQEPAAAAYQPFLCGAVQGTWLEDADLKTAMPAAYCGGSEAIPPDSCAVPGCTSTVPATHAHWTQQQLSDFKAELEAAVSAPYQLKVLPSAASWMDDASGPLHPIPPQPLPEGSSTEPHQITPRPWQYPVTWNLPPQSTEANDIA
jgi:hypothetical protein